METNKKILNQKGMGILGWLGVVVLIVIVGSGTVYLMEANSSSKGPTVSDVAKNPENYYGQELSLKGEIENIKTPRIFTLDQENTGVGDEILVLSIPAVEPQGGASDSADLSSLNEQDVQVRGTVRKLISGDIKQQTGIDLDPQVVIDFENKPVLIARQVDFLPEN